MSSAPLMGIQEIAEMLNTTKGTVSSWRSRQELPEPDFTVSSNPTWLPATILAWARETGRLDANGKPQKRRGGPKVSVTKLTPAEQRAEVSERDQKIAELEARLRELTPAT